MDDALILLKLGFTIVEAFKLEDDLLAMPGHTLFLQAPVLSTYCDQHNIMLLCQFLSYMLQTLLTK